MAVIYTNVYYDTHGVEQKLRFRKEVVLTDPWCVKTHVAPPPPRLYTTTLFQYLIIWDKSPEHFAA